MFSNITDSLHLYEKNLLFHKTSHTYRQQLSSSNNIFFHLLFKRVHAILFFIHPHKKGIISELREGMEWQKNAPENEGSWKCLTFATLRLLIVLGSKDISRRAHQSIHLGLTRFYIGDFLRRYLYGEFCFVFASERAASYLADFQYRVTVCELNLKIFYQKVL